MNRFLQITVIVIVVILALLIAAHSVIVGLSYMPILLGGMGY